MLFVISSINQLFFPATDPTLSLLATFATYTVALIMRPVGGALFGIFGDRHGRKNAMMVTVTGISAITVLTGLLPTWNTVGIIAPILLIILRFAQGLFAGGEWASGSSITMESTPKSMRGLISGFLQSGYTFGFILASIIFQIVSHVYAGESFVEGGWRIMFYTAIGPGLLALLIRFKMNESGIWLEKKKLRKIEKNPLLRVLAKRENRRTLLLALIIMTGLMYSYYASIGFMPTFLEKYVGLDRQDVASIMIAATISSFIGTVLTGAISQYIGRMKTLIVFGLATITLAVPTAIGIYHPSSIIEKMFFTGVIVFVASTAFGPMPAFLSEIFPTEVRNTASGFAYNGGLIIGSWSPLIAIFFLSNVHQEFIPYAFAANMIIGSLIICIGSRVNPETRHFNIE
jgi:MFS family permease